MHKTDAEREREAALTLEDVRPAVDAAAEAMAELGRTARLTAKGLEALVNASIAALAAHSPWGEVKIETTEAGWSACAYGSGTGAEGDTPIAAVLAAARKLRQGGTGNGNG